jgi:hypothetical protein
MLVQTFNILNTGDIHTELTITRKGYGINYHKERVRAEIVEKGFYILDISWNRPKKK